MFHRQQGLLITSRGGDWQLSLSGRLIELRKILLFSGCSDVRRRLSLPFDFPISQTNPPAHKNTITQQVDKLRTRGSTTTLNFSLRNVMPAFDILYTFHASNELFAFKISNFTLNSYSCILTQQRLYFFLLAMISRDGGFASRLSFSKQILELFHRSVKEGNLDIRY